MVVRMDGAGLSRKRDIEEDWVLERIRLVETIVSRVEVVLLI
jgi:hypothetical protein